MTNVEKVMDVFGIDSKHEARLMCDVLGMDDYDAEYESEDELESNYER